jgi:hypothetical protein
MRMSSRPLAGRVDPLKSTLVLYRKDRFLMETIVFNSIQVTNYWFTLHRALGPLYQQAQTSSPNIRGISDQDVT